MRATNYSAVLADLRQQRADLDAAIRAIERLAGDEPTPAADPAEYSEIAAPRKTRRKATKAAKGPTARPTQAPTGADPAAILAALKAGPLSVAAVAEALGLPATTASYRLRQMAARGELTATGTTNNRRYAVA